MIFDEEFPAGLDARKLVEELGTMSPDGVARFLRAAGVRGQIAASRSCPIAQYVHQRTGAAVSVGSGSYTVYRDGAGSSRRMYSPMPDSVAAFVYKVDHGEYPELIEEEQ